MSKKIVYVGFWDAELRDLIKFLEENKYNEQETERIAKILRGDSVK